MKKLGLVFVLFFAYFCCVLNVYAEASDFVFCVFKFGFCMGTGE